MRAEIERWDEEAIIGHLDAVAPVSLQIEIDGRRVGEVMAEQSPNSSHVSFRLSTSHFPSSCLSKVRISGAGYTFTHPDSQPLPDTNKKYHSAFGGMWIDRADWQDILEEKVAGGEIGGDLADRIRVFVRDGFVIIPNAVPKDVIDQLNAEIEDVWSGNGRGLKIERYPPGGGGLEIVDVDPRYSNETTKLLDAYQKMASSRAATASAPAVEFMTAVFEDKPRAFQQLHFLWGSGQPIHKDTAYVKVDGNPMSMIATWLALEDVSQGTGELEYYVGSHRAPDYIFGGFSKWMESAPHEHDDFLTALHKEAAAHGFRRSSFLPKAGDLLLWHADLAHGGSKVENPGVTRKSLVTHFTAARNRPYYARFASYPDREEGGVVFSCAGGEISQ